MMALKPVRIYPRGKRRGSPNRHSERTMTKTLYNKLIEGAGGPGKLARKAGVSRQTVLNWRRGGDVCPELVIAVEAATGVSRHEIRADLSVIFRI